MSPNDTYPEHVVTAVVIAHDGAQWLPDAIPAVLDQTHQVHRLVAADTGSRDRSGTLLAGMIGPAVVFGMDRETGYGAAVARALRHPAANTPAGGSVTEWIWLLHDDCAPVPDALEELLRAATETPSAAVLGPKILDWSDRQVILEVGLAVDTAGRRVSGTEPREIDQGQHDGDRDVLAVGSAGMLIRRDVWDEVGGFDTGLILFREDVDFCWRVHAAGYRVRVITDSVVYHVEAAARGRRQISATPHPRRLDRRNALFVLFANLPLAAMVASLCGNLALSAARTLFFLLAKRPEAARDEAAAFGSVLAHPRRLLVARRRRPPGRRRAYGALRSQVPRGQSMRKLAEFAAATLSRSSSTDAVGEHHASDDPSDDDSLLTDTGLAQRILTNPGVLLFTALTVITLVAERSLLGSGPLGGGALLPAWGGASGLWSEYLSGFHAVGVGSAASAPPYVAVLAVLSTILGGKPWLAVAVIMIGCVPFSGLTAYLTARRVSSHASVRVWLAASYALLPVAAGAVAAGRLGTAVVFVLTPLIASAAWRTLTGPRRRARRAAWATGLLVAVAAAFVPLVAVVAVVIAAFAGLAFGRARRTLAVNLAIVAIVPPVLLVPWTIQVAQHPSVLLLEAGLQQPGLASRSLPASSLLLLGPGGPGTPPSWVTAGLLLAALAALLLRGRWLAVAASWGVALSGLLVAIVVSRMVVSPPGGGAAVPAWPGVALLIAATGLLLAAALTGENLHGLLAAGGLRRAAAMVAAITACSMPVLAAGFWLVSGVSGPVTRVAEPVLPEFVSVSSASGLRLRTLVLRTEHNSLSYSVLRGTEPPLGAPELAEPAPAERALDRVVAGLATPGGADIGDEGQSLAQFAIGYVLLPAPVDQGLARLLDGVSGLRPVSETPTFALWRVSDTVARVRVTEPGGTQVALPSGELDVSGATAPAAGGTLVLAEPASGSWHASLNGRPLTRLASPVGGWAQGFQLPPGGGKLDISRDETGRTLAVLLEVVALLIVGALALPGAKDSVPDGGHAARRGTRGREESPPPPARRSQRGGSRGKGRRRRPAGEEAEVTGPRRVMAGAGRRSSRVPDRSRSRGQRGRAPSPVPPDEEPGYPEAVPDEEYEYAEAPAGSLGRPEALAEDYDYPGGPGGAYEYPAQRGGEHGYPAEPAGRDDYPGGAAGEYDYPDGAYEHAAGPAGRDDYPGGPAGGYDYPGGRDGAYQRAAEPAGRDEYPSGPVRGYDYPRGPEDAYEHAAEPAERYDYPTSPEEASGYRASHEAGYPGAGYPSGDDAYRYPAADDDRYPAADDDRYPAADDDRYPAADDDRYPAADDDRYPAADDDRPETGWTPGGPVSQSREADW
ncbi:MAG TPA: glycosyltransferase [Streptosporangiaceae bacterium]